MYARDGPAARSRRGTFARKFFLPYELFTDVAASAGTGDVYFSGRRRRFSVTDRLEGNSRLVTTTTTTTTTTTMHSGSGSLAEVRFSGCAAPQLQRRAADAEPRKRIRRTRHKRPRDVHSRASKRRENEVEGGNKGARGGAGGMIAFDASNKVTPRGDGVSPFLQLASGSPVAAPSPDTRARAKEGRGGGERATRGRRVGCHV